MPNWSGGAQGAAGGAAVGTAILPGWGTAIGAGIGGLAGLFGGGGGDGSNQEDLRNRLKAYADSTSGRQAPQIGQGQLGRAQYSDFRSQQAGLISQLQAAANGTGPSAAAIQMREAMDRAAAAQTSAAATAGGRGVNQGAAYLNAANNGAAIQAQGARDTATIRAQEQLNAYGQLGQAVAQGRQADENIGQFNASAQNQMNLGNLQAQLQMLGLNDEAQLRALMGALGTNTGPGLGTQIFAGGANTLPSLIQRSYSQGQQQQTAPIYSPGPITSPSQVA